MGQESSQSRPATCGTNGGLFRPRTSRAEKLKRPRPSVARQRQGRYPHTSNCGGQLPPSPPTWSRVWGSKATPASINLTQSPSVSSLASGSSFSAHGGRQSPAAEALPLDARGEHGGGHPQHPAATAGPAHTLPPPMQPRPARGKTQRANITIATQNLNGRARLAADAAPTSKWQTVNALVRQQKVNVLGLQETHLTPTHLATITTLYQRRLLIFNSADPERPGASAGVAFAINKDITRTNNVRFIDLIPGRAALLILNWRDGATTSILNTYAPNRAASHPAFWSRLEAALHAEGITRIDFHLGDFNLVENAIDRAPARLDQLNAIDALRDFRTAFSLQDTWRVEHPDSRLFTFRTRREALFTQSRLDRIYTTPSVAAAVFEWRHQAGAFPSDHDLISVRYAPLDAPTIGAGRWTLPLTLLTDQAFLTSVVDCGRRLHTDIDGCAAARSAQHNPQRLWAKFKRDITSLARTAAKRAHGRIDSKLRALRADVAALESDPSLDTDNSIRRDIALLNDEIQHLADKKSTNERRRLKAKWHTHSDTLSKLWLRANAVK
ncbi:DNase I-like protein, partial [Auriscalpium vulgare]